MIKCFVRAIVILFVCGGLNLPSLAQNVSAEGVYIRQISAGRPSSESGLRLSGGGESGSRPSAGLNEFVGIATLLTHQHQAVRIATASAYMGTDHNSSQIQQHGDDNFAQVIQKGGKGNLAKVFQNGSRNETRVFQDGSGNTVTIKFTGNENYLDLSQYGVGNDFSTVWNNTIEGPYQDSRPSVIVQNGSNNSIVELGMGGVPVRVRQEGHDMEVVIRHNGANHVWDAYGR